jgi:hypothetical protein
LCLVIIHKDGHCQYIAIGVVGSYRWDHKVGAGSKNERYLLVFGLHQNNYATCIFSENVVLWYHLRALLYWSGSVERLSVEIIATDGNRKILLLKFSKGVLLLLLLLGVVVVVVVVVYEASEH